MTYILFWIIVSSWGVSSGTQVFHNKKSCEIAALAIKLKDTQFDATCFEDKGGNK